MNPAPPVINTRLDIISRITFIALRYKSVLHGSGISQISRRNGDGRAIVDLSSATAAI
jgi:hypothetical protein